MDEIRQRLFTAGALVKVGAFAAERVGSDHRIRLEAAVAYRAAQLYSPKRCQDPTSSLAQRRGNFCATQNFFRELKSFPLFRKSARRIFTRLFTVPVLTHATSRLGQDADQSVA
ncbi:MAG TPA: hypothetical protein VMY38_04500 [Gemmatimonadaceae bacterium]|nr:hypothetical protein [Gemmatimonadaceae bacterium]